MNTNIRIIQETSPVLTIVWILIFWLISVYIIMSQGFISSGFSISTDIFYISVSKLVLIQLVILLELLVVLFCIFKITNFSIEDLKVNITKNTVLSFFICFILSGIAAFIVWTLYLYPKHPSFSIGDSAKVLWLSIVPWIIACFIQASYEELLCHSWILVHLRRIFGYVSAVIFGGILFAAMHLFNSRYNASAIFNAFIYGMLMSYMFFKFNSIWAPIGLHFGWNLLLDLLNSGHLFTIKFSASVIVEHGSQLESHKTTLLVILALFFAVKIMPCFRGREKYIS